ncbi:MAG: hypothetical protein FH749_02405 [Firmicutes bacterium]|nr:hypothetical protein [Bacillota bacterium]
MPPPANHLKYIISQGGLVMAKKATSVALIFLLGMVVAGCVAEPVEPVAVVNGTEVTRHAFENELERTLKIYDLQGVEPSEADLEMIRGFIVDRLIIDTILLEAAETAGISEDSVDVDTELMLLRNSYASERAFFEALDAEGYSLAEYRDLLVRQLMFRQLFFTELKLHSIELATEEIEELNEFYETQLADREDAPERDEVIDYLTDLIRAEKSELVIIEYMENLWDQSDIEYLDF